LLTGEELADQQQQRLEQAHRRAEEERQGKEQALRQTEQERQDKDEAVRRAEQLAARLRALGIDPDAP
jgi:hypothetical protein